MASKFTVHVKSSYEELWRYNLSLMCGGFNSKAERIDFVKAESFVAEVGANLRSAPEGYSSKRELKLQTQPCESIVAYVYVIPNTLPRDRDVADCKPFEVSVKVQMGSETIYNIKHKINQWSGASIELKLPAAK